MSNRYDALILPADSAPVEAEVKKSLLFFDSVTLANPADYALVHDREMIERFPDMVLWSGDRNYFPRVPQYEEVIRGVLEQAVSFRNRGLLRITPSGQLPSLDPGINYTLWHSAISNKCLVEAAAPDRYSSLKPPLGIDGYMRGGIFSQSGYRSKYEIPDTISPVSFSDTDPEWSYFAHLRLGRALKFLRISHALQLIPLAFDKPNQDILTASVEFENLIDIHNFPGGNIRVSPIQLDFEILDSLQLLGALRDASWPEVAKLRRHTLPGMSKLRSYLYKAVRLNGRAAMMDIDAYNKELAILMNSYQKAKEDLAEAWTRLGVAAISRGLVAGIGSITLSGSGLLGFITSTPWIDLLTKIMMSGMVVTTALTSELQTLMPARNVVKQHPLHFIDRVAQ